MTKEEKRRLTGDMTQGSIGSGLMRFMIPIMIGNIFTQMYNMVDSIIVGQALDSNALAAISAGSSLTMVCSSFMVAVGAGASVVAAQYFGAKDRDGIDRTVNTTLILAIIVGLFLSTVPAILLKPLMHLLQIPDNIFDQAYSYLLIYMMGNICVFFYHMGTAVLRGLGDSDYPLYMLIMCSVLNIFLDLLFILVFHMGVAGAAVATIISQLLAAILIVARLCGKRFGVQINRKTFKITGTVAGIILTIGIPAGLQQLAMSLGNTVVSAFVNRFGSDTIAAFGSVIKIDGFVILPLMAIGNALTTYVGQNIGANKPDRLKEGIRFSVIITAAVGLGLGIILFFIAPFVCRIFTDNTDVIRMGGEGLRLLAFTYVFWGFAQAFSGILRGAGCSMPPFIINVIATLIRIAFAYVVGVRMGMYQGLWMAFAVTNVVNTILSFLYYKFGKWQKLGKNAASAG